MTAAIINAAVPTPADQTPVIIYVGMPPEAAVRAGTPCRATPRPIPRGRHAVQYAPGGTAPVGTVIQQDPPAGAQVARGRTVVITVAS